jgi:23S rRNA (pseudouridine1915-N3)-methyltransferase
VNIEIISIAKKQKGNYEPVYKELIKMISRFSKVTDNEIFPKNVAKAHTISPQASQKSYTLALKKYLKGGYNIALNPDSKELDSFSFSNLLKDRGVINFFIGGAFGLESTFLGQCNNDISCSCMVFLIRGI